MAGLISVVGLTSVTGFTYAGLVYALTSASLVYTLASAGLVSILVYAGFNSAGLTYTGLT